MNLALVEALQGVLFQWHRLAVVRFWAENETAGHASYLTTYHLTWFGLACAVLFVSGVFGVFGVKVSTTEWPAVIVMGIAKSAALYAQEIARASGASLRYAAGALLLTIGSSVAGVVAYRMTHSITPVLMASAAVFAMLSALCVWRNGSRVGVGGFNGDHFRTMLRYGLPLIPVFISVTALTRLDRPILALFATSSVVGVYAAATALIANMIAATCLIVVTPAYPWLLRESKYRPEHEYRRLHARLGLLMLSGVLAMATALYCGRFALLPLLLGTAIGDAAEPYVLPLLAIAVVGAFRAHFFDQAYHLYSRTRALMAINVATLIVAVVAVYVGARLAGINGLLCGLLVANALSLLASATFSRSFVNLKHLAGGIGALALVSVASCLTGEWLTRSSSYATTDPELMGIASAAGAMLVFAAGIYLTNVGAIRSLKWRHT
ncbi:lipopolysaccharide biosynthesis protein [Paraburkholderia phytofirmans]|uniref:lipopolysaccharide biosynthesis protein n=1 Tax=Paraburkholderia phytofirmans TaxID=261302 RepID=UPI0038BCA5EF